MSIQALNAMNRDMTKYYKLRDDDYRIYDKSEVSIILNMTLYFFLEWGGEYIIIEFENQEDLDLVCK